MNLIWMKINVLKVPTKMKIKMFHNLNNQIRTQAQVFKLKKLKIKPIQSKFQMMIILI